MCTLSTIDNINTTTPVHKYTHGIAIFVTKCYEHRIILFRGHVFKKGIEKN